MRVSPRRLLALLGSSGLSLGWPPSRAHEFGLVRPSAVPDLFEQLIVKATGRNGDAVFADAAVSVVRGPMATKGLVESVLLAELARDSERGWSILTTESDARTWEGRLAAVADDRLQQLAATKGPELLARTASARHAAQGHAGGLPKMNDLSELEGWLDERTSPAQRREAKRLSEWPGVMRMMGGETLYRVVALTIVYHEAGASDVSSVVGSDPLDSPQAMWQIQILADLLMAAYELDAEALKRPLLP